MVVCEEGIVRLEQNCRVRWFSCQFMQAGGDVGVGTASRGGAPWSVGAALRLPFTPGQPLGGLEVRALRRRAGVAPTR